MTDSMNLTGAITAVKTAVELAKLIHDSGTSLEKAELKYKLAGLTSALADVQIRLVGVQEDVTARDRRIAELDAAFAAKDLIARTNDAYYRVGQDGRPHGDPACLRCWEVDHRQRPLIQSPKSGRETLCPVCNTAYRESHTGRFE